MYFLNNSIHISLVELQEFCNGNNQALVQLYYSYLPELYLIAYRYVKSQEEAEDVVSDCFEKLFKMSIEKRNKKFIADEINIKALLLLMVKNRCLDVIKTKNNRNRIVDGIKKFLPTVGFNEIKETLADENFKLVLACLPEKEKEILLLSIEGFSNDEIGVQLKLSEKTIANLLSIARKKVKELWNTFME